MAAARAPKLSQSLKQALKASSASVTPIPAPPHNQSDQAWTALRDSADKHKLSQDTWLTLSVSTQSGRRGCKQEGGG